VEFQYLFTGVGCEYVLGDFADYLRQNGNDVVEWDCDCTSSEKPSFEMLDPARTIFLTSAHVRLTRRVATHVASHFLDRYPNYLSPLEIMAEFKPFFSVFIPHDLLSPYGDTNLDDRPFLNLFDLVLMPNQEVCGDVEHFCRCLPIGWIKYSENSKPIDGLQGKARGLNAAFFSHIEHYIPKLGVEGFVEYFKPILTESTAVKLPRWSGVDKVEAVIRERTGVVVIPSESSSIDVLLSCENVLINGSSSIVAEASLLNKNVICLLDGSVEPMESVVDKLQRFKEIQFHDYRQRSPVSDALLAYQPNISGNKVSPVRFGELHDLITSIAKLDSTVTGSAFQRA